MATMYNHYSFDTLGFAKALIDKGYERKQAEALAEVTKEYIMQEIATKKDLELMEERLTYKITIRMATIVVGAMSAFTLLLKLPFLSG